MRASVVYGLGLRLPPPTPPSPVGRDGPLAPLWADHLENYYH